VPGHSAYENIARFVKPLQYRFFMIAQFFHHRQGNCLKKTAWVEAGEEGSFGTTAASNIRCILGSSCIHARIIFAELAEGATQSNACVHVELTSQGPAIPIPLFKFLKKLHVQQKQEKKARLKDITALDKE
jgi:hypothetical protein